MADFDGVIDPIAEWADIPDLSVTAVARGGPSGAMNAQAKALTARTKQLRDETLLHLPSYAALRAYTGTRQAVYLTGYLVTSAPSGIAGVFIRDGSDTTTLDNGGLTIVSSNNVRWKRQYVGNADAAWFGPVGPSATTSRPAIQAGLDAIATLGGNRLLSYPSRCYLDDTIFLPSFCGLIGPAPIRYGFNNADPAPGLVANNFPNFRRWVIEPKTKDGSGNPIPYNTVLGGIGLPAGATYNCAVIDTLIVSVGTMPFGGIRMHGCPGSIVRDVGVVGCGTGLLVNKSFGGQYTGIHPITAYYGVIGWGECNANIFDIYHTQGVIRSRTVPADYQFPELAALNGNMISSLHLSTEAHSSRPFSLILGSTASNSVSNTIALTSEYSSGCVFMYNARGTIFTRMYMEGGKDTNNIPDVDFGIVAASSTFKMPAVTANFSSAGTLIDAGVNVVGDLGLNGIIGYSTLKPAKLDNSSRLTIRDISMASAGQTTPEKNVLFPDDPGNWIDAVLLNGWVNAGGLYSKVGYRINPLSGLFESRGVGVGPSSADNKVAFIIPVGYRMIAKDTFLAPIYNHITGEIIVQATGEVTPTTTGSAVNGISFASIRYAPEQ